MFTPKQLQEQTFDKAVFGGYDMKQVDDFLEPLTEDYTNLYKENSVLKSKMKILVEKLEEYRSQDASLKKTLVAAQQTADNIIAQAQKEASRILNDAEDVVAMRVAECRDQIAGEEARVAEAQNTAAAFISMVEAEVAKQLDTLQRLRVLSMAAVGVAPAEEEAEPLPMEESIPVEVEAAPVEEVAEEEPVVEEPAVEEPVFTPVEEIDEQGESQLTFDGEFKFADFN